MVELLALYNHFSNIVANRFNRVLDWKAVDYEHTFTIPMCNYMLIVNTLQDVVNNITLKSNSQYGYTFEDVESYSMNDSLVAQIRSTFEIFSEEEDDNGLLINMFINYDLEDVTQLRIILKFTSL